MHEIVFNFENMQEKIYLKQVNKFFFIPATSKKLYADI